MERQTYAQYIKNLRERWIGKTVIYNNGVSYKVVDVDYNGAILIDRPTELKKDTAIEEWKIQNGVYID